MMVIEQTINQLLLNNQAFQKNIAVAPNPFTNEIKISTDQNILSYQIIDLLGKTILKTNNKNAFDKNLFTIDAGTYILNLELENGQSSNHKIIKL